MFCKAEFYLALRRKNSLLVVLLFDEGTLFLENWAKCNCFTKWSSYVNWSCGQHSWNVVCLTFIMEIRLRTVNLYHLFTTALNKSGQKKSKCIDMSVFLWKTDSFRLIVMTLVGLVLQVWKIWCFPRFCSSLKQPFNSNGR